MMNIKHFAMLCLLPFLGFGSASALGNAARKSDMTVSSPFSNDNEKGKKTKSVRMGEYILYKGEVNAEGQPKGKGTLEITVKKDSVTLGKDVLSGTFQPDSMLHYSGFVEDGEITFASGWKFSGKMSYRFDEKFNFIEYRLVTGFLLVLYPNATKPESVMKVLPVCSKDSLVLARLLPCREPTIIVPNNFFNLIIQSTFYEWLAQIPQSRVKYKPDDISNLKSVSVYEERERFEEELKLYLKAKKHPKYSENRSFVDTGIQNTRKLIESCDERIAEIKGPYENWKKADPLIIENIEDLPFPKEMTCPYFSSMESLLPGKFLYPLSLSDFKHSGEYSFSCRARIKSVDKTKWDESNGWNADIVEPTLAFWSIDIDLNKIHEFWALEYYPPFLIQFNDGTKIASCTYSDNVNEHAISVTIPGRDNDEFIYSDTPGSDEMFDTGCILSMKVKRDGIDFEMKGKPRGSGHDCQVNFKKVNGDRYEGTGFINKDSSRDYLHWVFQTYYMPKTIDTKALESSFWAVTGTWKRANGKTEEWKDSQNLTARQDEKKAIEQGLAKALPPFYQKYGKKNVDQFVYGDPTVGMSLAMIRDLVYSKNQYIRKKVVYTLLSQREITVAEAIKYGSGTQVWRLGSTSGYYNDPYYAFILYVRNGKVIAGHVNW